MITGSTRDLSAGSCCHAGWRKENGNPKRRNTGERDPG